HIVLKHLLERLIARARLGSGHSECPPYNPEEIRHASRQFHPVLRDCPGLECAVRLRGRKHFRTSKPQQRNPPRERGLPGLPSRRQRAVERVFDQPAVIELLQSLYWQLETWISPRRRRLLNSSPYSRSVRAGEDTGPKQIFCCLRHCVGQLAGIPRGAEGPNRRVCESRASRASISWRRGLHALP